MKNKGFTLVELLAVIVILGILLAIAIPNIINLINNAKNDAYLRQNDLIIDAAQKYVLQNGKNITWTNDTATIYLRDLQDINLLDNPLKDPRGGRYNNNIPSGTRVTVTRNNNHYTYTLIAVGGLDTTSPVIAITGPDPLTMFQGDTYNEPGATATDDTDGNITSSIVTTNNINSSTIGTYTVTYNVTDASGNAATPVTRTVKVIGYTDYVVSEGVNKPKLITGMTPIKWNGSTWATTTESDATWYNYTTADKQWANARTSDGSMWVWIPRYAYQIATNYHTSTAGTINIKFIKETTNIASDGSIVATTPTYSGSSQTNYITHSAFTFGSTELTGIWVAKFKASISNTGDPCYTTPNPTNCDKTTLTLKIINNVSSWRNIKVGTAFTVARNMETSNTYGWGTSGTGLDTHLIKSVEWGATAYLAQSTFGINSEIWFNNSSTFLTGCAGTSATTTTFYNGCQYAYSATNGVNGGTTGNVYGIFDLSGPVYEYTAAYINNGTANLNTYGSSVVSANDKYKDLYPITTDGGLNNYSNASTKYGDAVYETSSQSGASFSWYNESSYMPNSTTPWFCRSGDYGTTAGAFYFGYCMGDAYNNMSFRPVLLVGAGL